MVKIVRFIDRKKLIELLQKDEYCEAYGLEAILRLFEENSYNCKITGGPASC